MKTNIGHYLLTDNEFKTQFEDCSLSPAHFSHEAHIRLAWIYIQAYTLEIAIERYCDQLTKYVTAANAKDKYNTTLTIASMKIVNHFVLRSKATDFPAFILEFPVLKNKFKDLVNAHYKKDIFKSSDAKQNFLEPDVPFH